MDKFSQGELLYCQRHGRYYCGCLGVVVGREGKLLALDAVYVR